VAQYGTASIGGSRLGDKGEVQFKVWRGGRIVWCRFVEAARVRGAVKCGVDLCWLRVGRGGSGDDRGCGGSAEG
jgi:hypothetical protein